MASENSAVIRSNAEMEEVSDIVAETAKEFSAMTEKEGKNLVFCHSMYLCLLIKIFTEKNVLIGNVISVISKRFSSERISLAVLLTSHAFHKLLL